MVSNCKINHTLNDQYHAGSSGVLDLGTISWLCLQPNSAYCADADFMRLLCKLSMSSNVEYTYTKIPC